MDLLKNHYEKFILGIVLVGVIFFAALLPGKIAHTREELERVLQAPEAGPPRPAVPVDLAPLEQALQTVANPPSLKLSDEHNLFNPVRWRRLGPGLPLEPDPRGTAEAQHFTVTAIRPLTFAVWFDSVRGTGPSMRYQFMILNEASPSPAMRRPAPRTLTPAPGQKNEVFTLMEIRGPVEDPTELVLELAADKQVVTLRRGGREGGFQKIVGYEADAAYPPANRTFRGLRVNQPVLLGEPWKVIAIDASSVTIESRTQKRETKQLASATNP